MTVIAAIAHEGKVWMGGDSRVSFPGSSGDTLATPKIFLKVSRSGSTTWLIGVSGNGRFKILEHTLEVPDIETSVEKTLYITFLPEVRRILKEHDALSHAPSGESTFKESNLIVGVKGEVCVIGSEFSVIRSIHNFDSIGSGSSVAQGTLFATRETALTPKERIQLALQAAEEFDRSVRGPFTILET